MIEGRVAIVTGASSGLGRATAVALARRGARLVLVGRDQARLADCAARVGRDDTLVLALDVAREADMQAMAARTLERFGRIDILVHSAGVLRAPGAPLRRVAEMPTPEWDTVVDINLRGTFLADRAVLPAMLAQGEGDILNISSRSGRVALAFDAPYCASKFGVHGLTEALAEEARSHGVRVQLVAPGKFDTEVLAQIGLPSPGRIPPPERVADTICWMLALPADTRLAPVLVEPLAQMAPTFPSHRKENPMSYSFGGAEDLRGKVVVITGGAGGIGLATAKAVAALGGAVVVADLSPAGVDKALGDIDTDAKLGVAMDVRVEADHARLVQATLERFGRIDALICSAGILRLRGTPPKLLVDTTTEEYDDVVGINLKGIFLANRAVLPTMLAQKSGQIINVSSVQGLQGRAYDSVYCASKFGVLGFTQAVAEEVRSHGVKVQALMPAQIATPMWEQNLPAPMPGDALPPERVADLIAFMLLQPEDTVLVGPVIAPLGARKRRAKPAASGE